MTQRSTRRSRACCRARGRALPRGQRGQDHAEMAIGVMELTAADGPQAVHRDPSHMIEQWSRGFQQLYPRARLARGLQRRPAQGRPSRAFVAASPPETGTR
ncbi:hypothetical protein HBB16_09545 [Pseudonocardia sp. MCCB 268]|nr:hypothetical protein [Pseudonocardia cytotoxica]